MKNKPASKRRISPAIELSAEAVRGINIYAQLERCRAEIAKFLTDNLGGEAFNVGTGKDITDSLENASNELWCNVVRNIEFAPAKAGAR